MAKNPNIGISFNASQFNSEVKKMKESLQSVQKEFKLTDSALQLSGEETRRYANKIDSLNKQLEIQREITAKSKEAIEQATKAHQAAAERLDKANRAYEEGAKAQNLSKEELKKLKDEVEMSQKAFEKAEKNVETWNKKLLDSEAAENKLKLAIKSTNEELQKRKIEAVTEKLDQLGSTLTKTGKGLTVGVTLPLVVIGKQALDTASDLVEAQNVVDTAFKDGAEAINMWSQNLLDTVGMSELTAKNISGVFKSMANGLQIADQAGTEMATTLTELVGDVASFYNVSQDISYTALKSVFTGETESLKRFGIVMTQANLQAFALSQGIKKNIDDMTQAQLATLRYNYVLDQLKDVQGDFARTSDSMSNQARLAQERFKALSVDLARELLPVATDLLKWSNDLMKNFNDLDDATKKNIVTMLALAAALGPVVTVTGNVITVTSQLFTLIQKHPVGMLITAIGLLISSFTAYSYVTGDAVSETDKLINKVNDLNKTYERNIANIEEQTTKQLAEISNAERLAVELDTLSNKANKTAEEKSKMAYYVDELNRIIPNLSLAINAETGELNKQIDTVYDAIDAYKQLIFIKAAEKKATAEAERIFNLEEQKRALESAKYGAEYNIQAYTEMIRNARPEEYILDEQANLKQALKDRENAVKELDKINQELSESQQRLDYYTNYSAQISPTQRTTGATRTPQYLPLPEGSKPISDKEAKRLAEEAARKAEEARKKRVEEYKKSVDERERLSQRWINTEETHGRLDTESKRDAYGRIAEYYRKYANEVLSISYMTESEKAELHKQYIEKAQDYDLQYFKLYKQMVNERLEASKKYIQARNELNDWGADSEIAAWERVKAYLKEYLDQGILSYQEYADKIDEINKSIRTSEQNAYKERRQDSDNWIAEQKFYGNLSAKEEIAAYERIRKYVTEYYNQGIIDFKEYQREISKIDQNIFSVRKKYLEDYVKEVEQSNKEAYESRKKAIEDEYKLIDREERREERQDKLKTLLEQERLYQNAATKEGKDRLLEIQNQIKDLQREEEREKREIEKENRLEQLQKEYEDMDNKQKSLLNNISKYAALTAGTIEEMTNKIAEMLGVISRFNVSDALALGRGPINQNTYNTFYQTNNPVIYDRTSATIWGSYMSPKF